MHSSLTSVGVVHSTWPSGTMLHMHAPTFNKWQKKKKIVHILTHCAMRGCGLTSLVACIYDNIRDIRERNVTIRNEIWTTNIRSLMFQDTREWVILWRLILQSLGCTSKMTSNFPEVFNFNWLFLKLNQFICNFTRGLLTAPVWGWASTILSNWRKYIYAQYFYLLNSLQISKHFLKISHLLILKRVHFPPGSFVR